MSIYDKASLVLIPSGTKTSKLYSQKPVSGDGDFTFSRSTAATRVNADGNIEKETQNLLLQSNSFDTTWTTSSASVTSGQTGYDGSSNAWLLTSTASNGNIEQTHSVTGVRTFSVYVKAGTADDVAIVNGSQTAAYFDLTDGSRSSLNSSGIDATSTDVGNGWYRLELAANSTSMVKIYPADGTSTIAGTIYIQDAQLEYGLVARDYIETTTAAVEGGITDNVPRLDYTDSSCPSLLLEPQRSNIVPYSEYIQANGWANSGDYILQFSHDSSITNPEGKQGVTAVSGDSKNRLLFAGFSTGDKVSFSVFAKSESDADFIFGSQYGNGRCTFNLNTGTLVSQQSNVDSYEVIDYGNGWRRFIINITFEDAINNGYLYSYMDWDDASTDAYIYGYQIERGSYATSYIPTYGSAVTRNQDSAETSISNLLGTQSYTIFLDYKIVGAESQSGNIYQMNIAGTGDNIWLFLNGTNGANWYLGTGNGGYIFGTNANDGLVVGSRSKIALTYDGSNFRYFINGVLFNSTTDMSFVDANTFIQLTANRHLVNLNSFVQLNSALTDQEAIDLTTL